MLSWLIKKFIKHCESTGKYWIITGRPHKDHGVEVPYLIRYFVFRSKYLTIYIHRFLRSDLDDLHDHPWSFMTYIIEGSYKEHTFYGVNERSINKNRLVFKNNKDFHRVEVNENLPIEDKEKGCLTLFVCGPKTKEWGFLDKGKWTPWWIYLNMPKKQEPWE